MQSKPFYLHSFCSRCLPVCEKPFLHLVRRSSLILHKEVKYWSMCLYGSLFPLETLAHITSDPLHSMSTEAITHSLDEIGRELLTSPCQHIAIAA